MTDARFPGVGHLDAPEGSGHLRKARTFARTTNAGRRFVIRPGFMRVLSATEGTATGAAHEPVTLSRPPAQLGLVLVTGWWNGAPGRRQPAGEEAGPHESRPEHECGSEIHDPPGIHEGSVGHGRRRAWS